MKLYIAIAKYIDSREISSKILTGREKAAFGCLFLMEEKGGAVYE